MKHQKEGRATSASTGALKVGWTNLVIIAELTCSTCTHDGCESASSAGARNRLQDHRGWLVAPLGWHGASKISELQVVMPI